MARGQLVFLTVVLFLVGTLGYAVVKSKDNYWSLRASILHEEEMKMMGGDLVFDEKERLANQIIMKAKHKEIEDAFSNEQTFLPSQNFLQVANKIRESPVFKIIQLMPKGAVLHAHDTAIVSSDYIFSNITFRPNLYVCENNSSMQFQFFDKPRSDECEWKLLSELRKNDKEKIIDRKILQLMTMITEKPEIAYPNSASAWFKFLNIFNVITPMLTYRPVYEDHFYHGLLEFYKDNIIYLELRSTLPTLYELDGTTYGPLEVARIYEKVTNRFIKDHPDFLGARLIYAPLRKMDSAQFNESLKIAQELKKTMPNFFAGFDLVGFEDNGPPLVEFVNQIRNLNEEIPLFFHAGETNWYGTNADENLIDAVILKSKRIGHGYAILKHSKVMEYARKNKIAIEISPISNQVLVLVKDLRNHPAAILFAENYPIVVSNDDPGLWGAMGLSYDFYEVFVGIMSRSADLRALKQLAMNSIIYSVMPENEKNRAMEVWKKRWNKFLDELIATVYCKNSRL